MKGNHELRLFVLCTAVILSSLITGWGQGTVTGRVIDASSEEPLSYCHIFNLRTVDGTITNEDGVFQLKDIRDDDTLRISFIGYSTREIVITDIRESPDIRLNPQSIALDELYIYANDDYLFSAIEQCASVMRKQPVREAKAYYYVATDIDGEPNELMECYYNGEVKGASVRRLKLKNGRAGLPLEGDRFFFNLQTSTAINMLETVDKQDRFPLTPLHYKSRKMQKVYDLQRLPNLSDTNTLHIAFSPVKEPKVHFSGEMWIDKDSKHLQKLELKIDDADIYPFFSMGNRSRITHISFDIVQTFREDDRGVFLDHIEFAYDLTLRHNLKNKQASLWNLESSCLLHFFEYDTTFITPYFDYDPGTDDYRQISFIPYDSTFWANMHGYEFSGEQARRLKYFEQEGFLLNYESDIKFTDAEKPVGILEKKNVLWSDKERINFGMNRSNSAPYLAEFLTDMVEVVVQIFLDVNAYDDRWAYNSATVLDVYKSYNYIGESPERNCYANIYFDLCEIQRRKMLDELVSGPQTRESIDAIYKRNIAELTDTLKSYDAQVNLGMELGAMKDWNEVVKAELDIDNIDLFRLGEVND